MPIDVASYLKFTPTDNTGSFAADAEGHVYYDDSEAQLKHYDGSNWGKVSKDLTYGVTPGYGPYTVDDNTSLLIHSDTSDTSTTFDDSSSSDHTITANGDAQHKTAQAKIGATSMYFDGTGDYLNLNHSATAFQFGTDDFTVDLWIWPDSDCFDGSYDTYIIGSTMVDDNDQSGYDYFNINLESSNGYRAGEWHNPGVVGSTLTAGSSTIPLDQTWTHVAFVKSGDNALLFQNGEIIDQTTGYDNYIYNGDTTLNIGAYVNGTLTWKGYMDEIRYSKGIARWTSNFEVY